MGAGTGRYQTLDFGTRHDTATNTYNMQQNKPDWTEVRNYYQMCRSYTQTAEKFGVTRSAVKNRAIRGRWSELPVPDKTGQQAASLPALPAEVLTVIVHIYL